MHFEPQALIFAAIAAATVLAWIFRPIPIWASSLAFPAVALIVGVVPGENFLVKLTTAYGGAFSHLMLLFVGGFLLAGAMHEHGLDRRLALTILSKRAFGASHARMVVGLGLCAWFISMWTSNTVTAILLIAIAKKMLAKAGEDRPGSVLARAAVLAIAYGAGIGGLATPIGTPPNLVGIAGLRDLANLDISFLEWMMFGVPVSLAMMIPLFFVLLPGVSSMEANLDYYARRELREELPCRLSRAEKTILWVFALALALWVVGGSAAVLGRALNLPQLAAWFRRYLPEGVIGLAAGLTLLFLRADNKPILRLGPAAKIVTDEVETLALLAGGLCLGELLSKTGLAQAIGHAAVQGLGVSSVLGISALGAVLAVVLTEVVSNTAAANIMVPIMLGVAVNAEVPPVPVVLATTFGCSLAFMFPISTPPNLSASQTGYVSWRQMAARGAGLDFLSVWVILGAIWLFFT